MTGSARVNTWLKPCLNPFLAKGKERPEVALEEFLEQFQEKCEAVFRPELRQGEKAIPGNV